MWCRVRSCSKLDKVMFELEGLDVFKNLKVWGLNWALFDYCPLLIEEKGG